MTALEKADGSNLSRPSNPELAILGSLRIGNRKDEKRKQSCIFAGTVLDGDYGLMLPESWKRI
jgi:hypothetical protein|tara:strand:- start:315 stop:503 length:189 start_codon:yes stop_codon:yes gene_type:complete